MLPSLDLSLFLARPPNCCYEAWARQNSSMMVTALTDAVAVLAWWAGIGMSSVSSLVMTNVEQT